MASTPQNRLTGVRGGLALTDGLANALSGAGTSVDRRSYDQYFLPQQNQQSIENAYRSSWLVRKVHDLPPFDMTREWREWHADEQRVEDIEAEEERLGVLFKVQRALLLARLYGGGALFLGFGDQNLTTEAKPRNMKGSLQYITVLSRLQLGFQDLDQDVRSPYFGQPKMWLLAGSQLRIHPSRIIPFVGQPKPEGALATDTLPGGTFWGDPLLMSVGDGLKNADVAQSTGASLMDEALIDVIGIEDLTELVSTDEGEQRLMRRLTTAKTSKSLHRALIKDAKETWEQKTYTFTGVTDMIRLFLQVASGAADIPATRLLGQSPQGMNSTGESDLVNYYDHLGSRQNVELRPHLSRLDQFLIPSALGSKPADVTWDFNPLWQMTPKDRAEFDYKRAQTSEIDARTGLIPVEALGKARQNQAIEDGTYPGLAQAIDEFGADIDVDPVEPGEEADLEPTPRRMAANDTAPRTLYVRRDVVNHAEIEAWAKGQGFKATVGAKMHVTVLYSKAPVDWMKMGENWSGDGKGQVTIQPGGPRVVEPLGDGGAIVLLFSSTELQWRHRNMIEAGASSDYPEFTPHVSITWDLGDVDLTKVTPYRGAIVLGPEIFEEIKEDWSASLVEDRK